jgi:mevalonate kinase
MDDPQFIRSYIKPQSILTNSVINCFLNNKEDQTFELLRSISELQFSEMSEMILPELTDKWQILLHSGEAVIKLCGAGGGGFYLMMTKEKDFDLEILNDFKLLKISI